MLPSDAVFLMLSFFLPFSCGLDNAPAEKLLSSDTCQIGTDRCRWLIERP
jgi:hypothetical protein